MNSPTMGPEAVPCLSVVIPTRRLEETLVRRLEGYRSLRRGTEFIVVEPDVQSGNEPGPSAPPPLKADRYEPPADAGFRVLKAPLGRGPQCNGGARAARGELLLFLHDDTELPDGAFELIERTFEEASVGAACFRLRFDKPSWQLALYAYFSRFDSVFTTFGDQGIIVRRAVFEELGGFPDWPLFEDVELGRRLRRHSRIVKLPAAVTTSAVRFERNGMVWQQVLNGWLILRFMLGASPEALAASYERRRSRR